MAVSWSCELSVPAYAALGRSLPAPRPRCAHCSEPMAFDGCYPQVVRERAVAHQVFVRRAYCRTCGRGEALLPDFVVVKRAHSASVIGAALLGASGIGLPEGAGELYRDVPGRTVRSWRQRFAQRAEDLWLRFSALTVAWGGELPWTHGPVSSSPAAVEAMGHAWRAAGRRPGSRLPPAWRLANVMVGGQLLYTRVDLPWPLQGRLLCRSRAP